jgi:dCTP deaminase
MIIVDRDIHKLIEERTVIIESIDPEQPFNPSEQIGAGSIDLRLSNSIRKYKQSVNTIDLSLTGDTEPAEIAPNGEFIIQPNELILATTLEIVLLPPNIAGIITGRSSIARLGLLVNVTQVYMQPGHSQLVPLQLVNITNRPIKIKASLPICQIVLMFTSSRAKVPYGDNKNAKYRNELLEPMPSKIGVELGLDDPDQISSSGNPAKYKELQEAVSLLRQETHEKSWLEGYKKRLNGVLFAVYLVLGACISIDLPEALAKPFPSTAFIVYTIIIIFCLVIIIIAKLGE